MNRNPGSAAGDTTYNTNSNTNTNTNPFASSNANSFQQIGYPPQSVSYSQGNPWAMNEMSEAIRGIGPFHPGPQGSDGYESDGDYDSDDEYDSDDGGDGYYSDDDDDDDDGYVSYEVDDDDDEGDGYDGDDDDDNNYNNSSDNSPVPRWFRGDNIGYGDSEWPADDDDEYEY